MSGCASGRLVVALAEVPASPPERRAEGRRRQTGIGRNLAREAAARLNHCRGADFRVGGGGDSRPVLATSPAHAQDTAIAISHSGKWVCAAAICGQAGLGIDVQAIERRDVLRLVEFMHWTGLLGPPAGDQQSDLDRFTQLWTLWEAAVKCDGGTVFAASTPAFESLSRLCHPGAEQSWSAGGYWAQSTRLDQRHWLTLVAACPAPPYLDVFHVDKSVAAAWQA